MNDTYLGLSEIGSLIQLQLNPQGWKILDHQQLFFAPGTWTLPALSHGLLYIVKMKRIARVATDQNYLLRLERAMNDVQGSRKLDHCTAPWRL